MAGFQPTQYATFGDIDIIMRIISDLVNRVESLEAKEEEIEAVEIENGLYEYYITNKEYKNEVQGCSKVYRKANRRRKVRSKKDD